MVQIIAALQEAIKTHVLPIWTARHPVVLVAESDSALRRQLVDALRRDYRTLEAATGAQAVRLGAQHLDPIALLLTEVRLPDLFGWELVELLRMDYPALAVLYVAAREEERNRPLTRRIPRPIVLPKPFRSEFLLQAARNELASHLHAA